MTAPMIVYGSRISYFTGKFETYLRYKEIPYELRPLDWRLYRVPTLASGHDPAGTAPFCRATRMVRD